MSAACLGTGSKDRSMEVTEECGICFMPTLKFSNTPRGLGLLKVGR